MFKDKLQTFDTALRDKFPAVHATLRPGTESRELKNLDIRNWFEWRNGQDENTTQLFLGNYRFIPLDEAQRQIAASRAVMPNPLQL